MLFPLSVAHLAGLTAFQLALLLFLLAGPHWAATPLLLFILATALAPFLPASSYFLPVRSRGGRKRPRVALSFDDGPDPLVTPQVLDLLDRHGLKAAFFLIAEKAQAHPGLVREILARGHDIGNHSWHHDVLMTLRGRHRLREEVAQAQAIFRTFGILPRAFRPPVGITAPGLWSVLLEQGMYCLNFSCRAADMGNRRVRNLAERLLRKVRPGDLILLHDVMPLHASASDFLGELEALLAGLRTRGLEVVPPAQLIGRAIMARRPEQRGATECFYDDLAPTYDHEQFETAVAMSRKLERDLFRGRLPDLAAMGGRALEIGAGTGIFTLELAPRFQEVHAFDISGNMLRLLEQKAAAAGMVNIRTHEGDAEELPLEGPYTLVCSFLAFEYFRDLPAFFRRLAPHMAPGARVYFITARSSFFRFFTQIGNALRQGLWLRARSRREVKAMLKAAGVEVLRMDGHLMKSWFSGGMLLEVEGRWPGDPVRHDG